MGAEVYVYAMGTAGYGSQATLLATSDSTTNSNGYFKFTTPYTCPTDNTPVYMVSVGGDASGGLGINPNAVVAADLGTCLQGKSAFVQLNEVTTVALAFSYSHFFSATLGGDQTTSFTDFIGGPSSTSQGLVRAHTSAATLVSINSGQPNTGITGVTVEANKILLLANILSYCINSTGETSTNDTSTHCGRLFNKTAPATGTRPSDTLQAAVQIALNPTQNVAALFSYDPPDAPFPDGYAATAPHDYSLGIKYTTNTLGLTSLPGVVSTLDIDGSGQIWFPSNAVGKVGLATYSPEAESFAGPYNSTSMVSPSQVAIDNLGYVWLNDNGSDVVSGYSLNAPVSTNFAKVLSAAYTSSSVTVDDSDQIKVGVNSGTTMDIGILSGDRSTFTQSGVSLDYPAASLAGSATGGEAIATGNTAGTAYSGYDLGDPGNGNSGNLVKAYDFADDMTGQIIATPNDFVQLRSYATGGTYDGLCIFSAQACYAFTGNTQLSPIGMVIDGAQTLWFADSGTGGVRFVTPSSTAGSNGSVYVTGSTVPVMQLLHNNAPNGNTMVAPSGIGIDFAGNVWVTNTGTGNLVLSELVGAATPTITPISANIVNTATSTIGTEPKQ